MDCAGWKYLEFLSSIILEKKSSHYISAFNSVFNGNQNCDFVVVAFCVDSPYSVSYASVSLFKT